MEEKIGIQVRKRTFERLQQLATPLVDDTDSLINKLIDCYEQGTGKQEGASDITTFWVSNRGEKIPVGLKLRGRYRSQTFAAQVERQGIVFEGEVFDSPSAAAIYAKNLMGLKGESANTNGWRFWQYLDESSQRWKSLDVWRKG